MKTQHNSGFYWRRRLRKEPLFQNEGKCSTAVQQYMRFLVIIHNLAIYFAFSLANLTLLVECFFEDSNLKIK